VLTKQPDSLPVLEPIKSTVQLVSDSARAVKDRWGRPAMREAARWVHRAVLSPGKDGYTKPYVFGGSRWPATLDVEFSTDHSWFTAVLVVVRRLRACASSSTSSRDSVGRRRLGARSPREIIVGT
jgi:hypothetical protein